MMQNLRSSKEKNSQHAAAVSAAAKLEQYAHASALTPPKKGSQQKGQQGGASDRKSQGQPQLQPLGAAPATQPSKSLCNKGPGLSDQNTNVNSELINDPNLPLNREPTITDVFMAVGVCNGSLKDLCEQMKGVKADLLLVRQDLQKTAERTTALEERVSGLEDNVLPITKEIKWLKEQLSKQASKLDEMENRSRRDNVRLIGLPERSEGANPIAFLEKWLGELIGKESFSASFSIIRAHRIPFRAPSEGGHPRPLLLRFLNYQDKVTLLRKIREAGEVFFKGAKISFYSDFSPDLQRRRAEFTQAKRNLQKFKLPYALLYPARLRVAALGETLFFNSPAEVEKWLKDNREKITNFT